MSKFFFKGTPDVMGNYGKSGYNPKPNVKPGSGIQLLNLVVTSDQRKAEVEVILAEHDLVASISVDKEAVENLIELDALINTPETVQVEKTPARNEPCSCGSGKKFKKSVAAS